MNEDQSNSHVTTIEDQKKVEVNQEVPKITSKVKPPKPKDLRRVASGKRLAELSRQARERKKREAEFAEKNLEESKTINFLPILGVIGVLWVVFL